MKLAAAALTKRPTQSASPAISKEGLARLIAIANQEHGVKNTDSAGDVLKADAAKTGIDSSAFAGKTFYTEDGTGVFVSSRPIGSGNRTAIAVRKPGDKMRVVTGCFRGSPKKLLAQSDQNHGVGSIYNEQYRDFLAEAFRSLPRADAPKRARQNLRAYMNAMRTKSSLLTAAA